jgi:hypothetical protein
VSDLSQKQFLFTRLVCKLMQFAWDNGYELKFGDAYRDPRAFGEIGKVISYGHPKSAHKQRLAIDLLLFKDGIWLTKTEDYIKLGEYWESLGGCWGGRFSDGNHFSIEINGIK